MRASRHQLHGAARVLLAGLAGGFFLLLHGCYSELDWREVPSPQGRFRITLPAKAQEQTRTLGGVSGAQTMTMISAQAAQWTFGVAYADYPGGAQAQIDTQRDALLRNISGIVTSEQTETSGGGNSHSRVIAAEGRKGDTVVVLRARFVADGPRLYQIAAVGPRGGVPETELDTFFSSFKLQN
jgi:hypothetical protein